MPREPENFYTFIRSIQKPGQGTERLRKRKWYLCRACPSWGGCDHRHNAIGHVIRRHPITANDASSSIEPSTDRSSVSSTPTPSRTSTPITAFMQPLFTHPALHQAFNAERYEDAIVALLTRRRLPFNAVTWPEMRELALACNPSIRKDQLITSRRTAVRHIVASHSAYIPYIREHLEKAIGRIHISSDLWTSPFRSSLLAVCAQWVDSDYRLRKALLGLPECRYSHSGEIQAQLLLKTIETFDIQRKLGYHTSDNASSNDTCLVELQTLLSEKYEASSLPNIILSIVLLT